MILGSKRNNSDVLNDIVYLCRVYKIQKVTGIFKKYMYIYAANYIGPSSCARPMLEVGDKKKKNSPHNYYYDS